MQTIFLCSIGPVQDFIATARRSRDLWYGSWFLSEVSKTVAKTIADTCGLNSLVFPAPFNSSDLAPGSRFNVANKIMAVLPPDQDVVSLSASIDAAIKSRLNDLWADAQSHIKGPLDTLKIANDQILDMVEFYWVAVDYEDEQEYKVAREKAEALLAARKNTRDFKQFPGSHKPKSSLDGYRESVIPVSAYPTINDKQKKQKEIDLYKKYNARAGEQLSGVDLLKRLGAKELEPSFPSTSGIAAAPFFAKPSRAEQWDDFVDDIKTILLEAGYLEEDLTDTDGFIFESRLAEFFPIKEEWVTAHKAFDEIMQKYFGYDKPSPYYAILAADGDNMGKFIDSKQTLDEHQAFSRQISAFAEKVPAMIARYQGKCIFAGGEDILAYLPLHQALLCLRELDAEYKNQMRGAAITENGKALQPTLSGGLVIAHHLEPLSDVLRLVRQAEKEAKNFSPKKNALCVILSKHSGADRSISDHWTDLLDRMEKMVSMARNNWISHGTAYELMELSREFSGINFPGRDDVIVKETIDRLKRKQQSGARGAVPDHVLQDFVCWIQNSKIPVDELAQELIVAAEFAKAYDLADMPRR